MGASGIVKRATDKFFTVSTTTPTMIGIHSASIANTWKSGARPLSALIPTMRLRNNISLKPSRGLRTFKDSQTMSFRKYSTKTAPPPPPPPADHNAKGRAILSRISRVFTFSISSVMVVGAVGLSGLVIYLIFSELFLPSGDTKTFNKAVNLVEKNETVQKVLDFQPGERLKAYGEVPGDKWVRNRPVQSVRQKGADGRDHLAMRFHVESASGHHGTVSLEQIDTSFWSSEFAYIALDLPSKKRVYIVEPKFASKQFVPRSGAGGFLGLKWGPKKD